MTKEKEPPSWMAPFVLYFREHKFLNQPIAHGVDGDAVPAALGGDLDVRALEDVFHILCRVVTLHLVEEHIPHLVVAAEVFDFPYQFIFCHLPCPISLQILVFSGERSIYSINAIVGAATSRPQRWTPEWMVEWYRATV